VKKVIAFLLTAVLLLSVAACNSKSDGGSPSNSGSSSSDKSANGDKVRTVRVLGSDMHQTWETRDKQESFKALNELLKKYNLQIECEVISNEQYMQVIQTRTAAAMDLPDIVRSEELGITSILNLGKQGIFIDIRELLAEYSNGNVEKYVEKYSKPLWNVITTPDGKVYWIPGQQLITYKNKEFYSNLTLLIRGDWLETLGLDKLTTLDEFRDTLKAFQENDVNKNGGKDEKMIFYLSSFQYIAPSFGLPAGLVMIDVYDHVAKSPWLMKEELVEYITYINTLIKEDLIDIDALDKSGEVILQKEKNNQVSAVCDWALGTWHDANVKEYGGYYVPVVLGKKKGEIPRTLAEDSFVTLSKFSVTKDVKDKQAVATLFDMIFTEEYANLYFYGAENVTHTVNEDGTKVFHPNFKDQDFYKEKATGAYLWQGLLPGLQLSTWESYILGLKEERPDLESFSENYCINQEYWLMGDAGLAVPTDEENELLATIENDIRTYSDETLTKLCLGQYDISQIDQYIETIKELGLDKLVKIYQDRHNRYLSVSGK